MCINTREKKKKEGELLERDQTDQRRDKDLWSTSKDEKLGVFGKDTDLTGERRSLGRFRRVERGTVL